jgi:hypothetical protein
VPLVGASVAVAKLDPKKTHWTAAAVADGIQGARTFRPMTDEEVAAYNKDPKGAEVKPDPKAVPPKS